jgi:phage baseplate assembly protein V
MTATLPRSRSTDRRYYGVVEAIVAKVTDDPEHECRVTLRFPFFDGATAESDWCRVAQPYAGNGYGAVFVPEVGDEVLVAFVHGDMRFPVVIGGLYNGVDKPPTDRTASRDQKMIKTKHGHQVVLDDSQGNEAIRITTQGGHELILDDHGGSIAVTGNGVKITLEDRGTVTVQAQTVNVESPDINLGAALASQHLIVAEEFMEIFNSHVHALPFPPIIATVPHTAVPPLTPAVFSQVVKVTE